MLTNGHLDLMMKGKPWTPRYNAPWSVPFFIYVHLGLILCLVGAYMLDFKLTQKSATWWPLRESWDI
jgi:hypothetical protein